MELLFDFLNRILEQGGVRDVILFLLAFAAFLGFNSWRKRYEKNAAAQIETQKQRDEAKLKAEQQDDVTEAMERTGDIEMRKEVTESVGWLRGQIVAINKQHSIEIAAKDETILGLRGQTSAQSGEISTLRGELAEARAALTTKDIQIARLEGADESEEEIERSINWAIEQYNVAKSENKELSATVKTLNERLSEVQASLADANAALLLLDGGISNAE